MHNTFPLQSRQIGNEIEREVCHYLRQQGLILQEHNYFGPHGEIDLIMLDRDQLVFIEVRYRKNTLFGSAAETVSLTKQRRIVQTARYYLMKKKKYDKISCRFDVVAVNNQSTQNISWIKNAFYAEHF